MTRLKQRGKLQSYEAPLFHFHFSTIWEYFLEPEELPEEETGA